VEPAACRTAETGSRCHILLILAGRVDNPCWSLPDALAARIRHGTRNPADPIFYGIPAHAWKKAGCGPHPDVAAAHQSSPRVGSVRRIPSPAQCRRSPIDSNLTPTSLREASATSDRVVAIAAHVDRSHTERPGPGQHLVPVSLEPPLVSFCVGQHPSTNGRNLKGVAMLGISVLGEATLRRRAHPGRKDR